MKYAIFLVVVIAFSITSVVWYDRLIIQPRTQAAEAERTQTARGAAAAEVTAARNAVAKVLAKLPAKLQILGPTERSYQQAHFTIDVEKLSVTIEPLMRKAETYVVSAAQELEADKWELIFQTKAGPSRMLIQKKYHTGAWAEFRWQYPYADDLCGDLWTVTAAR